MGEQIIKWILIGIVAGIWSTLYVLAADDHGHQAILIIFSILGAAHACKCAQRTEEARNG